MDEIIEENDLFDLDELDVAAHVGESTADGEASAIKAFNRYLVFLRDKYAGENTFEDWNDAPLEYFSRDVVSRFAGYLFMAKNSKTKKPVKLATDNKYLSHTKTVFDRRFAGRPTPFTDAPFYHGLRSNLKLYTTRCAADGTKVSDHAAAISAEDMLAFCRLLFESNVISDVQTRALLVMQWQTVGRISEATNLKASDLNFWNGPRSNNLKVTLSRLKTNEQVELMVFMHRNEWLLCPFHALASSIAIGHTFNSFFPNVGKSGAKHLNERFVSLEAEARAKRIDVTRDLTSHSVRRGATTFAGEHSDLDFIWLIQRGGWSVNKMHNMLIYMEYTVKNDSKVGRVLSNWMSSVDYGGKCPDYTVLGSEEFQLYCHFSACLLGSAQDLIVEVQRRLCSSLVMHYKSMTELYPSHRLVRRMKECCADFVSHEKLMSWSIALYRSFIDLNSAYVAVGSTETINSRSVTESMHSLFQVMQSNEIQLAELKQDSARDRAENISIGKQSVSLLQDLSERLRRLEKQNQQLQQQVRQFASSQSSTSGPVIPSTSRSSISRLAPVFTNAATSSSSGRKITKSTRAQEVDISYSDSDYHRDDENDNDDDEDEYVDEDNHHIDSNNLNGQSEADDAANKEEEQSFLNEYDIETVQHLFNQWYKRELYKLPRCTMLTRCAKILAVMKGLLPAGTIINKRPVGIDADGTNAWTGHISSLASEAQAAIIRAIYDTKTNAKRSSQLTGAFWTIVSYQKTIIDSGVVQLKNTIDKATDPDYVYTSIAQLKKRQRIGKRKAPKKKLRSTQI